MPLLCEKRGHVAILTLSRPEARNAWDEDFNEGLEARLSELEHDHEIRCVILTGDEKGAAFSAGANLADTETHTVASPAAFITGIPHWRKFVANLLTDFPKPVIAAVNGYAIGIGCIATYCCDLIVASERAEWRLPQVRLGIMPAYGGAVRLSRWVGKGHAMKAALGHPIDGAEAYRIGLAQWLVPHAELMATAQEVAARITANPPHAVRMTKRLMREALHTRLDTSLELAASFQALSHQTADHREAVAAFLEKRNPVFKG